MRCSLSGGPENQRRSDSGLLRCPACDTRNSFTNTSARNRRNRLEDVVIWTGAHRRVQRAAVSRAATVDTCVGDPLARLSAARAGVAVIEVEEPQFANPKR